MLRKASIPVVLADVSPTLATMGNNSNKKQGAISAYMDFQNRIHTLVNVDLGDPALDPDLPSVPDQSWLSVPVVFSVDEDAAQEWRVETASKPTRRDRFVIPYAEAPNTSRFPECSTLNAENLARSFSPSDSRSAERPVQTRKIRLGTCFGVSRLGNGIESECFQNTSFIEEITEEISQELTSNLFTQAAN